MEYIAVDDVRKHLEILKKYLRPVGSPEHPALNKEGSIRDIDFQFSPDGKTVLPSNKGLSFATSMKQFKRILSLKARHYREVHVYAFDDRTPLPKGLAILRDHPGHASLIVTEALTVRDLVLKLEAFSRHFELIGTIRVAGD